MKNDSDSRYILYTNVVGIIHSIQTYIITNGINNSFVFCCALHDFLTLSLKKQPTFQLFNFQLCHILTHSVFVFTRQSSDRMINNQTEEKDNKLPPALQLPSLSFASMPQFINNTKQQNNNNRNNNNISGIDVDANIDDMDQDNAAKHRDKQIKDIMKDDDFNNNTNNVNNHHCCYPSCYPCFDGILCNTC